MHCRLASVMAVCLLQRCRSFSTTVAGRRRFHTRIFVTDAEHLQHAVDCATHGLGKTFPNPAVGCVIVDQETGDVVGQGFHPRAGYPHAEVFALWEAAGLLSTTGVQAALAYQSDHVQRLSDQYKAEGGAMVQDSLKDRPVTAYVTLEPCCHYGQTPPCARSLLDAGVQRVVVGFRDPNPRVDGGGVALLQDAGIEVDTVDDPALAKACADLVTNFCKRITPRETVEVNGAMRRALRAKANQLKSTRQLAEMEWFEHAPNADVATVDIDVEWLERLDALLWDRELVILRLNKIADKKKEAKILGGRIAAALNAELAQTLGHTALLYRPGVPPRIDLAELVASYKGGTPSEE